MKQPTGVKFAVQLNMCHCASDNRLGATNCQIVSATKIDKTMALFKFGKNILSNAFKYTPKHNISTTAAVRIKESK